MRTEYEVISPVDGRTTARVQLATKEVIAENLVTLGNRRDGPDVDAVFEFLRRLSDRLGNQRELLFETTCLETGFIARDSKDIVDGAIEFLRGFPIYAEKILSDQRDISAIPHSYSVPSERLMRLQHRPARCIAAVLPQNAALSLAVIIIASALFAGSRMLLRPPLQSSGTATLLSKAILESAPPESSIALVLCSAEDFLDVCYNSAEVDVIHYIGSSRYASNILSNAFVAGKKCLVDGQGNGFLYLDDTFPLEDAVRIISMASTRFNGETCTSVNGVLVKETIYRDVEEALVETFQGLRAGHPLAEDVRVGPLFSEQQAIQLVSALRETAAMKVLCGGHASSAYFTPAIVSGVNPRDRLVREGLFGPALWIAPVREEHVWEWLKANRFPLSDSLLSTDRDMIQTFLNQSVAPRICLNADPSIESMFEPWGGYPPGGLNEVSNWTQKYRQAFVVDGKKDDIGEIRGSILR